MDKKLNITPTCMEGLCVIEPYIVEDERGLFYRVFCKNEMETIFQTTIKQINHSITKQKGTVRGLHFQYEPHSEVKIVKCIRGSVFDVVVDIRKDSPTFLQSYFIELTEKNKKMLLIPKGFAHGFQTLENDTELLYFHSNTYTPKNEGALNVNDPRLNIVWPLGMINLSKRDQEHVFLTDDFKGMEINVL